MDENKYYRSQTVELFGKKYEVKNKFSSSINNKNLLFVGYVKYLFKKIYSKIMDKLNNSVDMHFVKSLFEFLLIIFFLFLFLVFMFTISIIIRHDEKKNECIEKCHDYNSCIGDCTIYYEICKDYLGDKKDCFENNIKFVTVFKEIFKSCLFFIFYIIIGMILFFTIANFIIFIGYGINYLCEIVINKIKKINEKIPEFENV